jgi:hypothetical protein
MSETLSIRFLKPSSSSLLYFLATMIPTEVSKLMRTKKLFFIGLETMCGARLGELQTSHVSISLQNNSSNIYELVIELQAVILSLVALQAEVVI